MVYINLVLILIQKSLDGAVHDIQRRGINSKYYHKHLYNDANYLVLAQVIEAVTSFLCGKLL